jgi:hypothetical protein
MVFKPLLQFGKKYILPSVNKGKDSIKKEILSTKLLSSFKSLKNFKAMETRTTVSFSAFYCQEIFNNRSKRKKDGLLQPALAWRPTDGPLGTIRFQTQLLSLAIIRR